MQKQHIILLCEDLLDTRISQLQKLLNDLRESAANETKSTAGDKYETALAMLQIEQDNVRKQLQEAREQKSIFQSINWSLTSPIIKPGSLVQTNKGWFLLALAIGKIKIGNNNIVTLSPQSPLGKKLMGLKTGDQVSVNGITYTIQSIQ